MIGLTEDQLKFESAAEFESRLTDDFLAGRRHLDVAILAVFGAPGDGADWDSALGRFVPLVRRRGQIPQTIGFAQAFACANPYDTIYCDAADYRFGERTGGFFRSDSSWSDGRGGIALSRGVALDQAVAGISWPAMRTTQGDSGGPLLWVEERASGAPLAEREAARIFSWIASPDSTVTAEDRARLETMLDLDDDASSGPLSGRRLVIVGATSAVGALRNSSRTMFVDGTAIEEAQCAALVRRRPTAALCFCARYESYRNAARTDWSVRQWQSHCMRDAVSASLIDGR